MAACKNCGADEYHLQDGDKCPNCGHILYLTGEED